MMKPTLTTLVLAAGAFHAAQALAEPADYNGTWSVQLVSESGNCDRSANYTIAVEDGRVRYLPSGKEARVSVSGRVGPGGIVAIGVHQGLGSAEASGRLGDGSGSGTWKVSVLGCSGRWTAQRRTSTARR